MILNIIIRTWLTLILFTAVTALVGATAKETSHHGTNGRRVANALMTTASVLMVVDIVTLVGLGLYAIWTVK